MSRIGKKIISIPQGVEIKIQDNLFQVKGPKGELKVNVPENVIVEYNTDEKQVKVRVQEEENPKQRALWGLVRQLVFNAIEGVQKPFQKSLEFNGVGFKVALEGRKLKMDVGFSHSVYFELPQGIDATVEKNVVTISGIDKQQVGEIAAQIRRIKPPEPYKGKGIKYTTETIRRKAGKAAAK